MSQRFEAVLFDFGGVFVDAPFPAFAARSRELGLEARHFIELTFGPLDRDTDHPWHRVERGELSMIDAHGEIRALCREAAVDVDPFVLLAEIMMPQTQGHPKVVDCVRALRAAGLRTGLVTNNALEIRSHWRKVLPLEELFDDVVDSSEVGVRKPGSVIYEMALERLGGLTAEATIFLDDLAPNLDAAEKLGMTGILVEPDPEPALAELRSLVGEGVA